MLMDLFYNTAVSVRKKRRTHFHEFMLDVHQRIHQFKHTYAQRGTKAQSYDPIVPVALAIAQNSHLLCFDEFQVTDIADAMILRRLFEVLFDSGVIVVATSNRQPDDLYKNGLQRSNFLPFIGILKQYCAVIHLNSGVDYRQMVLAAAGDVYLTPNTFEANRKLVSSFNAFGGQTISHPRTLEFLGRKLHIENTHGPHAFFTFADLCAQPLSAVDYLEICKNFDVLFIQDIPRMTLASRTEARRFITLVDTLYDLKVKVVCSAEVPAQELFRPDVEHTHHHELMDDLGIVKDTANAQASIFTGEEEVFAFERTISRLVEMQSQAYWETKSSRTTTVV